MCSSCDVSVVAPVRATPVRGLVQRMRLALSLRGVYPTARHEDGVYRIGEQLLGPQNSQRYRFVSLSNGAVMLLPTDWPQFYVRIPSVPGTRAAHVMLSPLAAGVVLSLAVLDRSFQSPGKQAARVTANFLGVLDYFSQHEEALAIHTVLAAWCARVSQPLSPLRLALCPAPQDERDAAGRATVRHAAHDPQGIEMVLQEQ